ncbi:Probable Co/Zn/Cd efflux system membrane fusion protein [Pseudoalteromonas luteoviolacea B = ATCC 29581]|nr:Probable Co/Zn/Cd efflux system membrane fusion protein [Pseudoalteromonas luteoviolacea B = ATCC 29581]
MKTNPYLRALCHALALASLLLPVIAEEQQHALPIISLLETQQSNIQIESRTIYKRATSVFRDFAGEVKTNQYSSYLVTPRVESIVIERHVRMGDKVAKHSPLVTLFSPEMAKQQSGYLSTFHDWQRIEGLTSQTVSKKEKQQTFLAYQEAFGTLMALGMTAEQIEALPSRELKLLGQYTLLSEQYGTVLDDDFVNGQRIESGQSMLYIADERELWIDVQLPMNDEMALNLDSMALVDAVGTTLSARIVQKSHSVDRTTRSQFVRLLVNNQNDVLHRGMFVQVRLEVAQQNGMTVPESALVQSPDGDWLVFIKLDNGRYQATEVSRLDESDKGIVIDMPVPSAAVVIKGAFFLASEMAKANFDIHNH